MQNGAPILENRWMFAIVKITLNLWTNNSDPRVSAEKWKLHPLWDLYKIIDNSFTHNIQNFKLPNDHRQEDG